MSNKVCSLPILLSYSLTDEGKLKHHQTIVVGGNVLDVSVGPSLWQVVVSIDTVHKPGSMKNIRLEEMSHTDYFDTFELFSDLPNDDNGVRRPREWFFGS